jgi:hypothetical protein
MFVAGFVLDRLAMMRRFDPKVEDETVIATSPTRTSSALAGWSRRIPVRRDRPLMRGRIPKRPVQNEFKV